MIEREGDERLLENRNERFRQFIRERSKPRAESGAEDECLFDLRHRVTNSEWRRKQSGAAAFRSGKTSASLFSNFWAPPRSSSFPFSCSAARRPKSKSLPRPSCFSLRCQSLSPVSVIS